MGRTIKYASLLYKITAEYRSLANPNYTPAHRKIQDVYLPKNGTQQSLFSSQLPHPSQKKQPIKRKRKSRGI